jgi:hypothetical protein
MRDTRSQLALHQMQRDIQTRRNASAGNQITVIHDAGLHGNGSGRTQHVHAHMMRYCRPALQKSSHSQQKGTSAYRSDDDIGSFKRPFDEPRQFRAHGASQDDRNGIRTIAHDIPGSAGDDNDAGFLRSQSAGRFDLEPSYAACDGSAAFRSDEFYDNRAIRILGGSAQHFVWRNGIQQVEAVK